VRSAKYRRLVMDVPCDRGVPDGAA